MLKTMHRLANTEFQNTETPYGMDNISDERLNVVDSNDDSDEEEEDDQEDDDDSEEEEEEAGDWGHVDPAESNSPFPDSNAPSAPGSAV